MKTLIEKVKAIDKDAADYIQSEIAPRWAVKTWLSKQVEKMSPHGQLEIIFNWVDSPQGGDYWRGIYKRLKNGDN